MKVVKSKTQKTQTCQPIQAWNILINSIAENGENSGTP